MGCRQHYYYCGRHYRFGDIILKIGQAVKTMSMVETTNLTKVYDDVKVVDSLNLLIDEGQVFGFLGPNGAGKTTTILMLLGLTVPTSGEARIAGFNSTREALKVKRISGYVPEKVGFYNDLNARQNLEYTANLNGIFGNAANTAVAKAIEDVGLKDRAEEPVGHFSKGMKQRLAIADILVKQPKIAFLDEPTSGIDPAGINQILDLISQIARQNTMTIVISSHQLSQVQRICSHIGIMSKGKLISQGSIEQLSKKAGGGKVVIEIQLAEIPPGVIEGLKAVHGVSHVDRAENTLTITCSEDLRRQLSKVIADNNGLILNMHLQSFGLDDIYMKVLKEG
jgi:ABC-2 type transport system ATP-binding protein